MKFAKFAIAIVFVIGFVIGVSNAQYSSRDNPTALSSGEITGNLNDHNQERFYSFTAGPGQITITMDVQARRDDIGNISFELLARDGSTSLLCCYGAQGDAGGTGRDTASLNLQKRQTVILYTKSGPVGGGTYRIRVTGAATFGGQTIGRNDGENRNDGGNRNENSNYPANYPRGNGGGSSDSVDVPSSGIMRIRMKDGSVRNIDLSRVRNISIH
jgi:hypothetical protein